MKNIICLFPLIMSICSAKAQTLIGIKAGLNITNINVSGPNVGDGIVARGDFNAGVLANFKISGQFALQPEVLYSSQGGNLKDSSGSLKNDYLNIPLLFQFHHSSGLFAETGPQLGFLLSSKYNTGNNNIDTKNQTNTTDFSWSFGLGYQFSLFNMGLDLRYNLGFTNTSKVAPFVAKNSVFQFGVFYLFR
jgi:hypothetical protein